ncbi:integrase family protein [Xylanimonas cellulosilytica DSM 15894]|uniref:Integrase family protein n=1 Tax=Xylanimonas cellulosilytica (strain DSM 15894 / JCM 12276 / CECT 5975 / KCTC 9989 / LMG 20990 / NBRC 107835 / XIL07) TaxID=446471 RepID=D1BVP8_XYLCX|nr:integrase family protein [Xylanimonas cellulosilytica DSM 15894]
MARKTQRRREAWGSLRQLTSKRWQARYLGPDGRMYAARTEDDRPLTFLTKGDARAWLNKTHGAIAAGTWEPPAAAVERRALEAEQAARRDITFEQFADQWLETIKAEPGKGGRRRKPGTVLAYKGRIHNYLVGPLGDLKVREIDTDVVRRLAASIVAMPSQLRPEANHNGVAGDAIDTLKLVLRAAVREGLLDRMPDVATPQRKSVRHDQAHTPEDDVATPVQVDELYEAAPPRWRIGVLLAAWCQLRRGEVLGLQRRDIVWNEKRSAATLYVWRQKNGTTGELTDPKSDKGVRSMAVPPLMIKRLAAHLDTHVGEEPTSPVIPRTERGRTHVPATVWNDMWVNVRSKVAGLPAGYRFHDLRHTGLTRFAQEGATLAELMRRGGHGDIKIVLRYQKATMDRDVDLASRMSRTVAAELKRAKVRAAAE